MSSRDVTDFSGRDISQFGDEGYPYTYPFYYAEYVAPRELNDSEA
uniref:Uncharacterized protein n=2 Tax=viral metagenome TaxID=1070528 RepID=A0A6M3K2F2_9ZZZZ